MPQPERPDVESDEATGGMLPSSSTEEHDLRSTILLDRENAISTAPPSPSLLQGQAHRTPKAPLPRRSRSSGQRDEREQMHKLMH